MPASRATAFDRLAPDQRAAVELVLRQGRSYGELSDLLGMPEETIRSRARGGVAALAPDLPAPHRSGEIADWLLGQQSEAHASRTRALVLSDPAAHRWAAQVATPLREAAGGDAVPALPTGPETDTPRVNGKGAHAPAAGREAATADDAATAGEASPARDGVAPDRDASPTRDGARTAHAPAAGREAATADDAATAGEASPARDGAAPDRDASPTRDGARTARDASPTRDGAAATSRDAAPAPAARDADDALSAPDRDEPATARGSSSRLGGALLIGAAVLIVAAVLAFVFLRGDDEPETASTGETTTATATATPVATVVGPNDVLLRGPAGSTSVGIMRLFEANDQTVRFALAAQGVAPNASGQRYSIWLTRQDGTPRLLGDVKDPVPESGELTAAGPGNDETDEFLEWLQTYDSVAVTLDDEGAKEPGKVVLSGTLPTGSG